MIHPKVRKYMEDVMANDSMLADAMQYAHELWEEHGLEPLIGPITKEMIRTQFKDMLEKDQIYGFEEELDNDS